MMNVDRDGLPVSSASIDQILHGTWAVQALRTGLELGVFARLAEGDADVVALAAAISADRRALEALLDALVSLRLLTKKRSTYGLMPESRAYLVPSSELFIGQHIAKKRQNDEMWTTLTETVRSGEPPRQVRSDEEAQRFFPELAEALFPVNLAVAQRLADELDVASLPSGARVLDVAAGAGTWGIPMALANPGLRVSALDFPSVLEVTRKLTARYRVSDRYEYLAGNWRDVAWRPGSYDVAILGHILHHEGRAHARGLLDRCADALAPGGRLVIADFVADDDRAGPPWVMLFGVDMLMHSKEGCVFTQSELIAMLSDAGFEHIVRTSCGGSTALPLLLASKRVRAQKGSP